MDKTKIVAVAGGSGSGKTTIVRLLCKHNPGLDCVVINMDDYYIDQSDKTPSERDRVNFDHPDCIDSKLLLKHLKALAAGKEIDRPCYDFHTHTRSKEVVRVRPQKIVILDGIFGLYFPEIRDIASLKLYVDTPRDFRLLRRLLRDVSERGRSVEAVAMQYRESVAKMHAQYVSPSKIHADFIIPWLDEESRVVEILAKLLGSL